MAVLSDIFNGEHHIPGKIDDGCFYLSVRYRGAMATYDFDELTRLVISAHEHAVRVQLSGQPPNYLRIMLHPRDRDGVMSKRHPTLAQAISRLTPIAQ